MSFESLEILIGYEGVQQSWVSFETESSKDYIVGLSYILGIMTPLLHMGHFNITTRGRKHEHR